MRSQRRGDVFSDKIAAKRLINTRLMRGDDGDLLRRHAGQRENASHVDVAAACGLAGEAAMCKLPTAEEGD